MSDNIESVLHEDRKFPPSPEFSAAAHISSEEQYLEMWNRAKDDPAGFWGGLARENIDWFQDFEATMEGEMPETKWFVGGKTNACYNCVDRHVTTWRKNKAAIIWEGGTWRSAGSHVRRSASRSVEVCQRAQEARH